MDWISPLQCRFKQKEVIPIGGLLLSAAEFGEEGADAAATKTMGDHLGEMQQHAANQPKPEPLDIAGMAHEIAPSLVPRTPH
jgi:hypothetical protein